MEVEVFEEVATDDPRAVELYRSQRRAGAEALGLPEAPAEQQILDPEPQVEEEIPGLGPPDATLLLATVDGEPVGIGGVRDLGGPVAEIKSMYVTPAARRHGLARRLLSRLEEIAAARGCSATRLDTLTALGPACAFYASAGYVRIPDYNGSPFADRWYERRLD